MTQTLAQPCSNCQTEVSTAAVYCGRCGIRLKPEPLRLYRNNGKQTLDMIEGNWEEYHG